MRWDTKKKPESSLLEEIKVLRGQVAELEKSGSESKRLEDELKESENKLSSMLSSIGDHMSMMDKDLNILWANNIAKRIFGDGIIGKKCY